MLATRLVLWRDDAVDQFDVQTVGVGEEVDRDPADGGARQGEAQPVTSVDPSAAKGTGGGVEAGDSHREPNRPAVPERQRRLIRFDELVPGGQFNQNGSADQRQREGGAGDGIVTDAKHGRRWPGDLLEPKTGVEPQRRRHIRAPNSDVP